MLIKSSPCLKRLQKVFFIIFSLKYSYAFFKIPVSNDRAKTFFLHRIFFILWSMLQQHCSLLLPKGGILSMQFKTLSPLLTYGKCGISFNWLCSIICSVCDTHSRVTRYKTLNCVSGIVQYSGTDGAAICIQVTICMARRYTGEKN